MTPPILTWLMPAVQVIGAVVISRRIPWRSHPALILWLYSAAIFNLWAKFGVEWPYSAMAVKVAILAAVLCEVARYSRFPISRRACLIGTLAVLAGAVALVMQHSGFTVRQKVYLARSYFLVAVFAAMLAMTMWRRWRPTFECRRHMIYRVGATAWVGALALGGALVKGGPVFTVLRLPYTNRVWEIGSLLSYVAILTAISWLTVAMFRSVKPRKVAAQVAIKAEKRVVDKWKGLRRVA